MSTLHNLQKHNGGGVALRATFAALIALGSIPGAAVISSNFSPVAFAATRSSNDVPQGLAEKKAEVTRQIKALTNLDENAKKFYLDKVTNAKTERDVDGAAFDATYADSRIALGNVISVANAMKYDVAYSSVTQGKKETFEKKLQSAMEVYQNYYALRAIQIVQPELEAAMNALDGVSRDLAEKKAAVKDKLKDYGLSEQDKQKYEGEIDQARDENAANQVLLNAAKAALEKVITEANTKKSEVAYKKATQDRQDVFDVKLRSANTAIYAVNATTDTLNHARTDLTDAMGALDGVARDLAEKKTAATQTINSLTNLGDAKQSFLDQVTRARNAEDVAKAVADAQLADAKAALEKVIAEATNKKSEIAYTKATDGKKQAFEEKLNAATTAKDAQDATVDSLNQARTELEGAMGDLDGVAQDLAEKKTAAKQTINDLKNLEQQDKTTYCNQVDQRSDEHGVNRVVADAKFADAKAALKKVITEATNKKSEIAYTKASPEKKQAFEGRLRFAISLRDSFATLSLLNKAKTELTDAMGALDGVARDLAEKKAAAKQTIGALENLEQQDKTTYCGKVDQASDEAGVNKVVADAKLGDARLALDKVINAAYAKRNEVAYKKATPEKKQAFEGKLDAAFDVSLQGADSLNKARTELTDAMNALDGVARDLAEKKTAATQTIGGLTNLDENAKKPFVKQVTDAQNAEDVAKAVAAAKLADAKAKALKDLDTMILTPEQKDAAKKAIEDATDPDKVDKAIKAANEQSQVNAHTHDAEDIAESEAAKATSTLYRLYNPYTHEHLFTTDKDEYDNLVAAGWTGEESDGKVAVNQGKGVYRLFNPTTGEHHYTSKEDEVADCVKAGWVNEGVKFHSVQNGTVPVYSMYNPYEKKFYHHYTSDPDEIAKMVKDGWIKEEIKWYAVPNE